jgi:hypothetical protein
VGARRLAAGGAAKGASKGVEGVHSVDAELGAVSGSSEGDQGGGSRWLNDGKHGGAVATKGRRRKKGRSMGVAPFIAGGGGWQRRCELWVERWWW